MPTRLDVVHINTERTWRGGEQQTFSLAKGLLERNIACGLVCQPNTILAEKSKAAGIEVFEIAMHGEADFKAALKIRRILKARDCRLLHTHTSHAQTLGFWASFGLDLKRLASRRVAFSIYRHDAFKINAIKYMHMTDHYVAISKCIEQALINDGLDRDMISVVYSGIDPLRFAGITENDIASLRQSLGIAPNEKVILNAAHLSKEKGQAVLLAAMPDMLRKYPEIKLVFAGGGDASGLLETARNLHIADNVVFVGFREDIAAFYNMCDLFVLPSLSEGLGTAALDALALKKPVVVSDAGGLPEIVADGESGRVVPRGDADALADAVTACFDDMELSLAMAVCGYVDVLAKFTLDKMVEGNLKVYGELQPLIFKET